MRRNFVGRNNIFLLTNIVILVMTYTSDSGVSGSGMRIYEVDI